NCEIKVLGA
ncbi:unnamed protein product, partial [Allacma fusca]